MQSTPGVPPQWERVEPPGLALGLGLGPEQELALGLGPRRVAAPQAASGPRWSEGPPVRARPPDPWFAPESRVARSSLTRTLLLASSELSFTQRSAVRISQDTGHRVVYP